RPMPTSLLHCAAVFALASTPRVQWYDTPMSDPSRFSVAGHLETQLIGLAVGARAELLYRPFRADRGANLRSVSASRADLNMAISPLRSAGVSTLCPIESSPSSSGPAMNSRASLSRASHQSRGRRFT